jgi:hypothetical protein
MEFIVENLAAVTVRQQKTEEGLAALAASQQKAEERLQKADERQQKTDRSVRGLRTLVQTGMRILVRLEQNQQTLDTKIAALADAQIRTEDSLKVLVAVQKRTDQKFERWLDSMNKGANGHKKRSG